MSESLDRFYNMHQRLLQMVDELHRLGFEELRFARSRATQHIRLQVYAACLVDEGDWLLSPRRPLFTLSDTVVYLACRDDAHLARQWEDLLAGELKPRHLAGRFILDFPEIMRPAHAADHEYRQWFRSLRPYLQAGKLPMTYDEDAGIYGTGPDFSRFIQVYREHSKLELLPAPPPNPHLPE